MQPLLLQVLSLILDQLRQKLRICFFGVVGTLLAKMISIWLEQVEGGAWLCILTSLISQTAWSASLPSHKNFEVFVHKRAGAIDGYLL